jgi:ABC-type sugar transport system ATPase subunit
MSSTVSHVELRAVSKRFGGAQALQEADLRVTAGTVHALVGENGAGKSTLAKIVGGVYRPDSGTLLVHGAAVDFRHPADALAAGIVTIAQEVALAPTRSVIENVYLGIEPTRGGFVGRKALRRRYQELDELTGFGIPPDVLVRTLRLADQQKVEILRALARDAKLILMDEPTASLSRTDAERLHDVVRELCQRGTTILYVSHFLKEVLGIAEAVTVLRDGRVVSSGPTARETPASLVTAMLGRSIDLAFPPKRAVPAGSPAVLSVRGLVGHGVSRPVDLDVRAGEIVGLAGLVGAGRTELARLIFGAARASAGVVMIDGQRVDLRNPRAAIRAGIALIPESRKDQGLFLTHSIASNVSLPFLPEVERAGFISRSREREAASALMQSLDVRAQSPVDKVGALSGGNQQKVLFAKWLFKTPKVLLADEPTRGVDVGAKSAIYKIIHALADQGVAVLVISSETEELVGLCHRILVMRSGSVVAEFDDESADEESVTRAAFEAGNA